VAWRPTFFPRRQFEHPDGRLILVWENTERDHWVVEARRPDFKAARPRWTKKTEQEAADIVWFLMGTDERWRAVEVGTTHRKPRRWH
jgi:hypothetical protein